MKIGIIGATGNAGSAIYREASARGHEVVAIVRNEEKAKEMFGNSVKTITKDAFELKRGELEGFDAIIDAFAVKNVDWVGISPGNLFQAGEAKPAILGKDHLLQNDAGQSVTSSGTLAKAILDELEVPQYQQTRFTVIDA